MSDIAGGVVSWLWEQYGKELANRAYGKMKDQWSRVKWKESEAKYLARLRNQHSITRLLGNPKPIEIEDIYTDVYVLDLPTALKKYSLEELEKSLTQNRKLASPGTDQKRHALLSLTKDNRRLYLLGKPGAGKTTFLRYLTLQACAGYIRGTPIFVELKGWAASGLNLMSYLVREFEICSFPDAETFIKHLLENGDSLILFDGLDEVNQEGQQRSVIIRELKDFARQYPKSRICLTCRIAATDYSFEQFTYLEIADFTDEQVQKLTGKWYQTEKSRGQRFINELNKPENSGLKELTRTPLLLTLLCLAFDQTLEFPANRTELYKEAFDALLKRWDASRDIHRNTMYKKITSIRRENMLVRIAAINFEKNRYFIPNTLLADQISNYLKQLPGVEASEEFDGEVVLKEIEAQHGILVERASGIYSFSHLTFQEYLTARYVLDNVNNGALNRLLGNHVIEDRWREVILMTASLLNDATEFFVIFSNTINNLLLKHPTNIAALQWAYQNAQSKGLKSANLGNEKILYVLLFALSIDLSRKLTNLRDNFNGNHKNTDVSQALDVSRTLAVAIDLARSLEGKNGKGPETLIEWFSRERAFDLTRALDRSFTSAIQFDDARRLASDLILDIRRILLDHYKIVLKDPRDWNLNFQDSEYFYPYIKASQLLFDCLQIAVLPNREEILTKMFFPPTV